MRFEGTIEPFSDVDVKGYAEAILAVPQWEWLKLCDAHSGEKYKPLATELVEKHYPGCIVAGCGLWILMPGQVHPSHTDVQDEHWITRVHVPILTNEHVVFTMNDGAHQMVVGKAYRFNNLTPHAVSNGGITPRVHLLFDVHRNHL